MYFSNLTERSKNEPSFFRRRLTKQLQESEKANRQLNCYLDLFLSAETVEQVFPLIEKRKIEKPLFGLTCAVKDCFAVKGHPLTGGVTPSIDKHSKRHAGAVETLVNLGVSLIGSTNLDPLNLGVLGDNPHFGRVNQPHFRERIPGGSSAGSAVAVAANLCDFALASDLSGSARVPAAACCVSGMRCSSDFFRKENSLLLESMVDAVGLIGVDAIDLSHILHTIKEVEAGEVKKKSLIFPAESEVTRLDPYAENALSDTLNRLQEDYTISNEKRIGFETANTLIKEVVALDFAEKVSAFNIPNLPDQAKALCSLAGTFSEFKREELRERQMTLRESVQGLLGDGSVIVTPTLPSRPPAWKTLRREKQLIDNLCYYLTLANVCDLPAVSIVLGVPGEHFPFSLQVIGAPGSDLETVQFAASLQEHLMTGREANSDV
jgi:Asp-tRNA(Asn)/Glu-tRNA(Gln) amidotransferase A subunit family amidase